VREPRDLPNIDGFEFIGITGDGEKKCHVVQDPETTCHYVDGEAKYCELLSWKPIEKPNRG